MAGESGSGREAPDAAEPVSAEAGGSGRFCRPLLLETSAAPLVPSLLVVSGAVLTSDADLAVSAAKPGTSRSGTVDEEVI